MSDLKQAAQQALEAWDTYENGTMDHPLSGVMEALRAALEAQEEHDTDCHAQGVCQRSGYSIGAPKQDVPEAGCGNMVWMVYTQDGKSVCVTDNPADFTDMHRALPLYTSPPAREPLTEDEIRLAFYAAREDKMKGCGDGSKHRLSVVEIARVVERAHGITGGGDE